VRLFSTLLIRRPWTVVEKISVSLYVLTYRFVAILHDMDDNCAFV